MPDGPKEFQESITLELNTIKNRVRFLIGSAHWGEEGRYKEAILKNVFRQFLPTNISVGTGFIVKSTDGQDHKISKQIDIIIYDNTLPVLFREGDFIITTGANVLGIIEVKTKIVLSNLSGIISSYEASIADFQELRDPSRKIFTGLFAYEMEGNLDGIDQALSNSRKYLKYISLGKDIFLHHWGRDEENAPRSSCQADFYNLYELTDLSFSYFISNLLHKTSNVELSDRYWYSFPIIGTKEENRIRTICMGG